MKKLGLLCCSLLMLGSVATAQMPKAPTTPGGVFEASLKNVENEIVPAAEAMPEDKYSFVPTNGEFKGVRTFAQQVKHVAAVNYIVAAALLGEKAPVDVGGESGPDSMTSKADIVKFLKASFDYSRKAVATMTDKNVMEMVNSPFGDGKAPRLQVASIIGAHTFDHYGQIVVYLRMNGIVPPASRQ